MLWLTVRLCNMLKFYNWPLSAQQPAIAYIFTHICVKLYTRGKGDWGFCIHIAEKMYVLTQHTRLIKSFNVHDVLNRLSVDKKRC